MARSRRPLSVVMSGAFKSVWACRAESQLPIRMPTDFALFTRLMPAASSGASRPLSAASAASFRIADILIMMEARPEPAGFQGYPPRANGGLGEAGPGRLLEPGQELVQRHVVHAFRDRRGDAVEHERLQFLPPFELFNHN